VVFVAADDKGHSLVGVAERDCGRDYAFSDGSVPCRTSDCLVAISGRLETFDLSLRNPILRYQTTFSTVGITGSFQYHVQPSPIGRETTKEIEGSIKVFILVSGPPRFYRQQALPAWN
jgi:hypothetical protein